jgi:hypothetical protein
MSLDNLHLVHNETIRLQALGNALRAMAGAEINIDDCQLEEIGQMVVELAKQIQDKLINLDRENYRRGKEAQKGDEA